MDKLLKKKVCSSAFNYINEHRKGHIHLFLNDFLLHKVWLLSFYIFKEASTDH